MGRKRKHRDRENNEEILRKLRRLEKTICSRRDSYDTHSSESTSDIERHTRSDTEYENRYYLPYYDQYAENIQTEPQVIEVVSQTPVNDDLMPNPDLCETKTCNDQPQPSTSSKNDENEIIVGEVTHLDDEILTLLGDAPKEESPVGPDIHSDIASRLQDVLQNGLKKEQKDKIIEEYPTPGNCQLFKAPVLNAEVKAAISDLLLKKDSSLAARQGQIGVALTVLAKTMDILVSEKSELSQQVLKHVSSACRLLCDSHYIDTKLRRNFLISTLNNKLKDTLKESKRDKSLFGEDLADKLKATKAITKSSQDLKYNKPKSTISKTLAPTNLPNSNLNWKHPQSSHQNLIRKPAPPNRSAGATSTPQYRSRSEMDSRRRPPAPRARASAPYKRRQ